MRKIMILGAAIFCLVAGVAGAGDLDKDYSEAVCNYFKVDIAAVDAVVDAGITPEEVPVVFFVAEKSRTKPMTIAQVRARGDSWSGIVKSRNLGSDIFYQYVVGFIDSPTYFPIFEKYKTASPNQWRNLPMTDNEIIDLVNLKFISSSHDYSVYEVMEMRDQGNDFMTVNRGVQEAKGIWVAQQRANRGKTANAGF